VTVKTWSGHSNVSMLLDTYSHEMIDPADEWADFWRFAYRERRGCGPPYVSNREANRKPA
jgi:hypothetical protein